MKALTVEYLQEQLPKKKKSLVTPEVIDHINKLAEDPDYGEYFIECTVNYLDIVGKGTDKNIRGWSVDEYLNAVKYFSLMSTGMSQAKAYAKVFPERLQSRLDRGQTINDMAGEASRYNQSELVNKIREQATVPFHLVNQHVRQKAVNRLESLMTHARSEVAMVNAATALLKELRPPEAHQVELQVGLSDEAREVQQKQTNALLDIANNQRRLLEAGYSIEEIQQIHIKKDDAVDAELEDEEDE